MGIRRKLIYVLGTGGRHGHRPYKRIVAPRFYYRKDQGGVSYF